MIRFDPPFPFPSFARAAAAFFLLAPAVLGAGCGNLTAGGLTGEAVLAVSGDAPDEGAARAPGWRPARVAAAASASDDEPEGEIELEFLPFLVGADGTSTALSAEEIRVRVDVRGRREADVASRIVQAKRYTGIRFVFTEVEVEVESGLVVDGVPIVGDVEVELEDATLTVVRPLSLDVSDGGRVELLLDLNSTAWLTSVDPDLRTVVEEIFAEAVSIRVR